MKTLLVRSLLASSAALLACAALAQNTATPPAAQAKTHAKPAAAAQDPGERKFAENCARCHNPPESLSPRVVGTVLRHMRVRASLSAQDEKDILHFLAP